MSETMVAALLTIGAMFLVPAIAAVVQLGRVLEKIATIERFVREDFASVQIKVSNHNDDIHQIKTDIAVIHTVLNLPHAPRKNPETEEVKRANPHAV